MEPTLRKEWLPEGNWKLLDFADEDAEGIEVVEYLEPVLRRVDLSNGSFTYSS